MSIAFRQVSGNAHVVPLLLRKRSQLMLIEQQQRGLSSYVLDRFSRGSSGGSIGAWPVTKMNTIFNIVPQGQMYVVERFGRLHTIQESGWFLAIPIVDTISYAIDVRERALDIPPQSAITRDNVAVEVSGNLFVQFVNAEKAAYGAMNPLYSVTQHAQSAMRSAIGEMELDEMLHGRARLNALIKGSLQEAAIPWGLEIRRYEITEITPDPQIRLAMDKQAAAERDRREKVLRAEGEKQRVQLTSEGVKISLQNESEGTLIKIRNEAEAYKTQQIREAEGQAEAIVKTARAQAEALKMIADQLQRPNGMEAARMSLAKEYITMYGEMGSQSNTMIFNDRPGDVSALMAQAVTALTAAQHNAKMMTASSSSSPSSSSLPTTTIEADGGRLEPNSPDNTPISDADGMTHDHVEEEYAHHHEDQPQHPK